MSGYQPLIDREPELEPESESELDTDFKHEDFQGSSSRANIDPESLLDITQTDMDSTYCNDSRDSSIGDLQQVIPVGGSSGGSGGGGSGGSGGSSGSSGGSGSVMQPYQLRRTQYRCVICLEQVAQAYSCKQCNECKICMGCLQTFVNSKFCDNTCPVCKKADDWLMFEHETVKFYVDANMLRRAFRSTETQHVTSEPIVTVYEYRRNNFENVLFSLCIFICILFAPFFFYYWLLVSGS